MAHVGKGVLILYSGETVGGAFFSVHHRTLHGDELRIRLSAPLDVREKVGVKLTEAGPRDPPTAVGVSVAVVGLLGVPDDGLTGATSLRVVVCEVARWRHATSTSSIGHGRKEKKPKSGEIFRRSWRLVAVARGECGEGDRVASDKA